MTKDTHRNKALLGMVLLLGGVLVKTLVGPKPGALILYSSQGSSAGHFRQVAQQIAELWSLAVVIPAVNGDDLLIPLLTGTWRGTPLRPFGLVAFVGHGSSTSFFAPGSWGLRTQGSSRPRWVSAREHAAALASFLAPNAVVSFVGCRAGADLREGDWVSDNYGPGGAQSLAALYRDALVSARAPNGVEVRAHTTTGEAGGNPMGRSFPVREVGRPGRSLMQQVQGERSWTDPALRQQWAGRVRGTTAFRWIAGV